MNLVSALSISDATSFHNIATRHLTAQHISTAGVISRDMGTLSEAASPDSTGSSEPLSLSYSSVGTSCSDEAGVGPGWGLYPPAIDTGFEVSAALESRARSDFVMRPIGYGRTVNQSTTRHPDPTNLPSADTFSNLQGSDWDGARSLTPAFGSIGQPYRPTAWDDFSQPPPSSLHEGTRARNSKLRPILGRPAVSLPLTRVTDAEIANSPLFHQLCGSWDMLNQENINVGAFKLVNDFNEFLLCLNPRLGEDNFVRLLRMGPSHNGYHGNLLEEQVAQGSPDLYSPNSDSASPTYRRPEALLVRVGCDKEERPLRLTRLLSQDVLKDLNLLPEVQTLGINQPEGDKRLDVNDNQVAEAAGGGGIPPAVGGNQTIAPAVGGNQTIAPAVGGNQAVAPAVGGNQVAPAVAVNQAVLPAISPAIDSGLAEVLKEENGPPSTDVPFQSYQLFPPCFASGISTSKCATNSTNNGAQESQEKAHQDGEPGEINNQSTDDLQEQQDSGQPNHGTNPADEAAATPTGDHHYHPTATNASSSHTSSTEEKFCGFCQGKGKSEEQYTSHQIRDTNGRVTCPALRSVICPLCGATGAYAHTQFYCPERWAYSYGPVVDRRGRRGRSYRC